MELEKDVIHDPIMQLTNGQITFVLKDPQSGRVIGDVTQQVVKALIAALERP